MTQDCKNVALKLAKMSLSKRYFGQFKGYLLCSGNVRGFCASEGGSCLRGFTIVLTSRGGGAYKRGGRIKFLLRGGGGFEMYPPPPPYTRGRAKKVPFVKLAF